MASLPKRFYKIVDAEDRFGQYFILLDKSVTYTPKLIPLTCPNRDIALRMVQEWRLQDDVIDHAKMPVTRLVNVALDATPSDVVEIANELIKYSQTDLICYQAGAPDGLIAEQAKVWGHIRNWVEINLNTRLIVANGVKYAAQFPEFKQKFAQTIAGITSPFTLCAMHLMTTLSGSSLISWAVYANFLSAEEGWRAAHVDELYQEKTWGIDEEAHKRRLNRWKDFEAAAYVASNLRKQ